MIVQVVAPGAIGGLETVVGALMAASANSDRAMRCVALLSPQDQVPEALARAADDAGVPVIRVEAPHRQYRAQYHALCRALAALNASVAHSHGYHADVLSAFATRRLRLAHISTLHGFVGGSFRSRAYEWLQLRSLRGAAGVVCVSERIVERTIASGVPAARVHLIPNAAPTLSPLPRAEARAALGIAASSRAVAWIGRFSHEKHPLGFVHLLSELPVEASVVGVMLGDGPCFAAVREAGTTLETTGRLVLAGARPNAASLMSAFDALVITSSTEGTPMVALEAMRAGVPVVSTNVGGVPALLDDGRAGVLTSFGAPAVMAQALRQLLDDPLLAQRITTAARDRVDTHYSTVSWWSRHAALYTSATG